MKRIFFTYWLWHVSLLVINASGIQMSLTQVYWYNIVMALNFGYLIIMPLYDIISAKRSTRSDAKYMNACLASLITRVIILIIATFGFMDYQYILLADIVTIGAYFIMKKKLERFTDSQINEHLCEIENYKL